MQHRTRREAGVTFADGSNVRGDFAGQQHWSSCSMAGSMNRSGSTQYAARSTAAGSTQYEVVVRSMQLQQSQHRTKAVMQSEVPQYRQHAE
jgi:hypothetical protein